MMIQLPTVPPSAPAVRVTLAPVLTLIHAVVAVKPQEVKELLRVDPVDRSCSLTPDIPVSIKIAPDEKETLSFGANARL